MKCICNKIVLAEQVELATRFTQRLKGLMGRPCMPAGTAMLLAPCPQIHTCFMRFPIDVLFLDKQDRVVYVLEQMKPWRLSPLVPTAVKTVEIPAGTLKNRVKKGDVVIFE